MRACTLNYDQRACNINTNPMNFTLVNGTFNLNSLVISLYIHQANITFIGTHSGAIMYNETHFFNDSIIWIFAVNIPNIDTISLEIEPQSQTPVITLDNICITV